MRATIVGAFLLMAVRPAAASPGPDPPPEPLCAPERVAPIPLIRCPARTERIVACPIRHVIDMPGLSAELSDAVMQWCVPDEPRRMRGVEPLNGGPALGPYLVSYADGTPAHAGQFPGGSLSGVWRKWHRNGVRASVKHYANGWLNGRLTEWYANGQRARTGRATYDRRQGTWRWWDETGALTDEVTFVNERELRRTSYYPDGRKHSDNYSGRWTIWYPDGRKELDMRCRRGETHRRRWSPDGTILEDRMLPPGDQMAMPSCAAR